MTALAIANQALTKLGEAPVAAFNEDSNRARTVLSFFPVAAEEVATEEFWTFNLKRAELVIDEVGDNLTEFTYRYTLPADVLRIHSVDPVSEWRQEEGALFSNENELTLRYSYPIVDASTPDAPEIAAGVTLPVRIEMAISLRLAFHSLLPLNGNPGLQQIIAMEYNVMVQAARQHNALDAQNDPIPDGWHDEIA